MFSGGQARFQGVNKSRGLIIYRSDEYIKLRNQIKSRKSNRKDDVNGQYYVNLHKLPPRWIDTYEVTKDKIEEIRSMSQEIQKLYEEKVRQSTTLSEGILEQRFQTQLDACILMIKDCEKNLNEIKNNQDYDESAADASIRNNIQMNLAQQIQDITYELRKQQKQIYDSLGKVNHQKMGLQPVQDNRASVNSNLDLMKGSQQFVVENIEIDYLQKFNQQRGERIERIVKTIKQLSELFEQMNQIVIEQGTLFDRIDFNLDKIIKKTDGGTKLLQKANQKGAKSARVQKCICCLLISIILALVILILKHTILA